MERKCLNTVVAESGVVDDGCLVLMFIRQPLYELGSRDTISQGISTLYETSSCRVCSLAVSSRGVFPSTLILFLHLFKMRLSVRGHNLNFFKRLLMSRFDGPVS